MHSWSNADTPATEVEAVIREATGDLLEAIRLFDVYEGDQIPSSHKSLAYSLRLRSEGHTLSAEQLHNLRDRIISWSQNAWGAH